MVFCKPALSVNEQISLLQKRGLLIPDVKKAAFQLSHINYYRLRAYWLPYESTTPNGEHCFKHGVSWDDIEYVYNFDAQLRILLLEAIGAVEISLRTRWAYYLSITYGPQAHEDPSIFFDKTEHQKHLAKLKEEYKNSKETFADHYRTKYPELNLPPIWVACELMTLGELSKWIKNLARLADQRAVFSQYGYNEAIMVPFLHHMSVVRNVCAHYGRVWNKRFTFAIKIPRKSMSLFNLKAPAKIYNTIVMLALLMEEISPGTDWAHRIMHLVKNHPQIQPFTLGFPPLWDTLPLWAIKTDEAAAGKTNA